MRQGGRFCTTRIGVAKPFIHYAKPMQWWEETVHALVVMHDWKQQKQLEESIRELVRLAGVRAELEGYEQGLADGKRRAVNDIGTVYHHLTIVV